MDLYVLVFFLSFFLPELLSSHIVYTGYYVIGGIIAIISVLFTVYHKQIVHFLQPAANWMHK
jgi:hypothetical protein